MVWTAPSCVDFSFNGWALPVSFYTKLRDKEWLQYVETTEIANNHLDWGMCVSLLSNGCAAFTHGPSINIIFIAAAYQFLFLFLQF